MTEVFLWRRNQTGQYGFKRDFTAGDLVANKGCVGKATEQLCEELVFVCTCCARFAGTAAQNRLSTSLPTADRRPGSGSTCTHREHWHLFEVQQKAPSGLCKKGSRRQVAEGMSGLGWWIAMMCRIHLICVDLTGADAPLRRNSPASRERCRRYIAASFQVSNTPPRTGNFADWGTCFVHSALEWAQLGKMELLSPYSENTGQLEVRSQCGISSIKTRNLSVL